MSENTIIQKLEEELEKQEFNLEHSGRIESAYSIEEVEEKIKILKAKLQKQALTLKLKDVEKDIEWLEKIINMWKDVGYFGLGELKQKLQEKQAEKDEIIKELKEIK